MLSKEESVFNIKRCIEGIKLNDENLDYHINSLIREVEAKERVEILEMIDNWYVRCLSKKDILYSETLEKLKKDIWK